MQMDDMMGSSIAMWKQTNEINMHTFHSQHISLPHSKARLSMARLSDAGELTHATFPWLHLYVIKHSASVVKIRTAFYHTVLTFHDAHPSVMCAVLSTSSRSSKTTSIPKQQVAAPCLNSSHTMKHMLP